MAETPCPYCSARLEPGSTRCPMCGSELKTAAAPSDPEGLTVVAEDDAEFVLVPAIGQVAPGDAEPAFTIMEEPEPVTAIVNLEIADVEDGLRVVEVEIAEGAAYTIGRDGRVTDYVPTDPRASRRHFSLGLAPEGLYLADLGSSNGTLVNGVRIAESVWLKDGDTIEYGRSKAVVHVVQMPQKT